MPTSIATRLEQLRQWLAAEQLEAWIVSTSDEHLNEYVPDHKQRLAVLTGFSGSLGTAVILRESRPQLFVDSRYHLQAEQSCGALFDIQKQGNSGVLDPHEWLAEQPGNLRMGADPFVTAPRTWRRFAKALIGTAHTLTAVHPNPADTICTDRPAPLCNPIYPLGVEFTGKSTAQKLEELRTAMQEAKTTALVLTLLDEIAWLANLRGSDVAHNPVFEAYAVITDSEAFCFCHRPESGLQDARPEWKFRPYSDYLGFLKELAEHEDLRVWLDPAGTTMGTRQAFADEQVHEAQNPVVLAKALKNSVELECSRTAHRRAGSALVRSFVKLRNALDSGTAVSERKYSDWLREEYSREAGFSDLSFTTIAGSGANGAIVHYGNPSPEKCLEPGEMLLVDSGIQCAGATTDATRTLAVSSASDLQRRRYTRVLQAHIRLARQVFPEGTTGAALDAITRSCLWNDGLDFGHGTGHGVGAFLGVHEGPQRISPTSHDVPLQEGMIVSNEPGFYESGWGGIRIENLCVVVKAEAHPPHPGGKPWLQLETLTLVPYDPVLIDRRLLNPDEREWLDAYQVRVLEEIGPLLPDKSHQRWLEQACAA